MSYFKDEDIVGRRTFEDVGSQTITCRECMGEDDWKALAQGEILTQSEVEKDEGV